MRICQPVALIVGVPSIEQSTTASTVPLSGPISLPALSTPLPAANPVTLPDLRHPLSSHLSTSLAVPRHYAGTAVHLGPPLGSNTGPLPDPSNAATALASVRAVAERNSGSNTSGRAVHPVKPSSAPPAVVALLAEQRIILSPDVDQTLLASLELTPTGRLNKPTLHIRCDCCFRSSTDPADQSCTPLTRVADLITILKRCYGGTNSVTNSSAHDC